MELTDDCSQHPFSLDMGTWRSPHLTWQRGNILLVNKLIFWKVAICFKFLSSSCHLESEIDCHFTRQGCSWSRQSCVCTYQHSLTKLGAWLGCYGLLVYSCLRTRMEAHPWIPIRWAAYSACCKLAFCPQVKCIVVQASNYLFYFLLCCFCSLFPKTDVGIHSSSASILSHTCRGRILTEVGFKRASRQRSDVISLRAVF